MAAPKLEGNDLHSAVASLPCWALDGGELVRTWTFPDFVAAMGFVNQVAALAESAGHHPDIDIRYNKVRLALVTHDSGGITSRDVERRGGSAPSECLSTRSSPESGTARALLSTASTAWKIFSNFYKNTYC